MPVIRKLKEGGASPGIFREGAVHGGAAASAPDLQLAIDIEYTYGWRTKSEVLSPERRQIDLKEGTLRLEPARRRTTRAGSCTL